MTHELSLLDATAQAGLVARGERTATELVEAAIARCEKQGAELGALVTRQFERALAAAADPPRGPFRGVPFLLKDLGAHLDGDPVYNGMAALRDADYRARGETCFAGRLRDSGLVTLGRTNSPELGLMPTTEPAAFGPSRNPWDPGHSPGGSSGGSAAAVAAGVVPAAHASDGGGSIRIPASHCGLVGLKPARGRCSFGPDLGERWSGFSCEGFVTRSVRDTAALLDVVAGPMPGDPYTAPPPARPFAREVGADPGALRVGFMTRVPREGEIHPDCVAAVESAARLLESLGHRVEQAHPEALDHPEAPAGFVGVIMASTAYALDFWGEQIGRTLGPGDVEPATWAMAEIGRQRSAADYVRAVAINHAQSRRVLAWWQQGFDLLLTPTCSQPPPPLGRFDATGDNPLQGLAAAVAYSCFTSPFNVTGQPALSLPLHESGAGLPIGVQLVADSYREDLLLRVAAQIEAAQPWADRIPPIHASR